MNTAIIAAGLVVCVITLVIAGIKFAQKGGEQRGRDRERADRLADSAERRAREDESRSRALSGDADAVADRIARRSGLPGSTEGS